MSNSRYSHQVLVVDADRMFSASLALKFVLHGHYANFAQSGTEALEQVSRFHPTIAILGTKLPNLPTSELARSLEERLPACRIVFLSDHSNLCLLDDLPAGGEVLTKSIHPEVVYEELSQLVFFGCDTDLAAFSASTYMDEIERWGQEEE